MGVFDKLQSMFSKGDKKSAPSLGTSRHNPKKVDIPRRFELLRKAISGTMSKFYLARDRESDELVGLKVGDREKVEMFEQRFKGLGKPPEGEIAAQIRHERVVKTHEYGMTTDNLPYVIMEFLDGPGMQEMVHKRDARLAANHVELIRQMAQSLEAVHLAGFIHRDICPRNFISAPDGKSLKLIDFGLTLPAEKEYMQPGNRTGTPLYMAPEVIRRRWTDHRLDIFAFGVTAYHICALELPWPVSDTTGLAALAHDTQEPREITDHCPNLDKALAKAIMKSMDPEPNDRFQTMDQFLRHIDDVSSETSKIDPPTE